MRPLRRTPAVPSSESVAGASVGSVVERQVAVEDGQERDRLDRGGEQAERPPEQTRAGQVQQPQRDRAEHRDGHARERVELSGCSANARTTPCGPP